MLVCERGDKVIVGQLTNFELKISLNPAEASAGCAPKVEVVAKFPVTQYVELLPIVVIAFPELCKPGELVVTALSTHNSVPVVALYPAIKT